MQATVTPEFKYELELALAEASFHDYIKQAWHVVEPSTPFIDGWYVGALAEHLQACSERQITYLIVNIPPRTIKSLGGAVFWPSWHWGPHNDPAARWLYSSYSAARSTDDSVKCRDVILSEWYQSRWGNRFQLKGDQNLKTRFENDKTGVRLATAVRGRGTGDGGDFVVVDDPHSVMDSESDKKREATINWWLGTMSTRGNTPTKTVRVVIMQRLHERDLAGVVLEMASELGAELLMLPMHYDPARSRVTSIGWRDNRKVAGELLCPERFTPEVVRKLEVQLGPYKASGQLEQDPKPATGGIYDRKLFKYTKEESLPKAEDAPADAVGDFLVKLPQPNQSGGLTWKTYKGSECFWFQCCDTALKTDEENDETAVGTFLWTPGHELIWWDAWAERVPVPEQYGMLANKRAEFPEVRVQAVEDAASGIGLIQQAASEGRPFLVLKADRDKVRRATAAATAYRAGTLYHRGGGLHGMVKAEGQLIGFPNTKLKDLADVLAYAAQLVLTPLFQQFNGQKRQVALHDGGQYSDRELREWQDMSYLQRIVRDMDRDEGDDY
jgi:phage terminase large subunit-like protein